MNDVSHIVSGEGLRTAQAARHLAPQVRAPKAPAHAESRELAPAKNAPPPGPGTPARDAPIGSIINILV